MVFAVAIFPKNIPKIELVRKRNDPRYKNIPAHITLIFPFPESLSKNKLIKHIKEIMEKFEGFKVSTDKTEISWDNALLLLIDKGKRKLKKLHDELYSGDLAKYLNEEYKYKPHITIGVFDKNISAKKIQKSYPKMKFDIEINSVKLLQLNTDEKFIKTNIPKIIWSKEIFFKSKSLLGDHSNN